MQTMLDKMKEMAAKESAAARRTWGATTLDRKSGESPAAREKRLEAQREKAEARRVMLRDMHQSGMTPVQISRRTGIPLGTVKTDLFTKGRAA